MKMNKKLRAVMAVVLAVSLLAALPVSASSTSSNTTVGGSRVDWSLSCSSSNASACVSTNTQLSAMTSTLTFYYTLDTSSGSSIASTGPRTASGNGSAYVTLGVPDSRYTGYRAIGSFTASIAGEYWSSGSKTCYK